MKQKEGKKKVQLISHLTSIVSPMLMTREFGIGSTGTHVLSLSI
jgi:hypothetical protein